jgi:hypothetical protein
MFGLRIREIVRNDLRQGPKTVSRCCRAGDYYTARAKRGARTPAKVSQRKTGVAHRSPRNARGSVPRSPRSVTSLKCARSTTPVPSYQSVPRRRGPAAHGTPKRLDPSLTRVTFSLNYFRDLLCYLSTQKVIYFVFVS